mgnify:CR=1 FL=1
MTDDLTFERNGYVKTLQDALSEKERQIKTLEADMRAMGSFTNYYMDKIEEVAEEVRDKVSSSASRFFAAGELLKKVVELARAFSNRNEEEDEDAVNA